MVTIVFQEVTLHRDRNAANGFVAAKVLVFGAVDKAHGALDLCMSTLLAEHWHRGSKDDPAAIWVMSSCFETSRLPMTSKQRRRAILQGTSRPSGVMSVIKCTS